MSDQLITRKRSTATRMFTASGPAEGRQARYSRRYPERHYARVAVWRATEEGKMPKARTLPCHDCGKPAREYDHHLGWERQNWLDVQPVCRRCHLNREMDRRTHCHRGHEYTDADWGIVEGYKRRQCHECVVYRDEHPGRPYQAGHPNGERHGSAKLTEDQVRAIRADETWSLRRIAAKYGVSNSTILAIRNRQTWKHVA